MRRSVYMKVCRVDRGLVGWMAECSLNPVKNVGILHTCIVGDLGRFSQRDIIGEVST